MLMIEPLLAKTLQQVAGNVLNVLVTEEVDNPYLKATLTPLIETFLTGVMEGLSSREMSQKILDDGAGNALPKLVQEEANGFMDQLTLNASKTVN